MLKDIAALLQQIEPPGSFATRRTGVAEDLRLEVKSVGPIRFPVSSVVGRKLHAVSRPARYGLRDRTLLDRDVRDCGEIPKTRIRIDQSRWKRTLDPMLARIARDLGIPSGSPLRAELYNLLVYGPGQFFVPHQDTEKTDDMIATMVVTLPTTFKGGGTVIEHRDEKIAYRVSAEKLTFVAFYADCLHEVRPITEGYRLALTYNLCLDRNSRTSGPPAVFPNADLLKERVQQHFETPLPPRWRRDSPRERPDRLVYLLDHQYTRKGLAWDRLKNRDAARAAALRAVAERLNCSIALALADVHETWSCEDDDYGPSWRYRDRYEHLLEEDPEEHTLVELISSEIELRHFVDLDGKRLLPISSPLEDDEVCFTRPSDELAPFASEHEGYMGNYGNTVDRWYHRAAVVLWPRERTFVIRAKASASWAIRELGKTLEASALDEARSMAGELLPFWESVARREEGRGFVENTLRVAEAIQLPEVASSLVKPFALEQMTVDTGPLWARLHDRYGGEWCETLLAQCSSGRAGQEGPGRNAWLLSLPRFCEALGSGSPGAMQLSRWLVNAQWRWFADAYAARRRYLPGKLATDGLLRLHEAWLALLESSLVSEDPRLQREILEFPGFRELKAVELDTLLLLLRAAASDPRRGIPAALGLGSVHERCTRTLRARLSDPPRADDDWSIPAPSRCSCELCQKLATFLLARDRSRFEWPLAKAGRMHVHQTIDRYDLPVTHQTRRSGSPHTLVLAKTQALFERERAKRKAWTSDLDWLEKVKHRFLGKSGPAQAPRSRFRRPAPQGAPGESCTRR